MSKAIRLGLGIVALTALLGAVAGQEARAADMPAAPMLKAPIRAQYDVQGHPYYASARLWDDGIIDPADSRRVLGLSLSAAVGFDALSFDFATFDRFDGPPVDRSGVDAGPG